MIFDKYIQGVNKIEAADSRGCHKCENMNKTFECAIPL